MKPSFFSVTESPVGFVLAAATHNGVNNIRIMKDEQQLLAAFKKDHPQAQEFSTPILMEAMLQLKEYFSGRRENLTFPIDVQTGPFIQRVWQVMRNIPYGATVSYTELAAMAGNPKAFRAAATACSSNPVALYHPCHRVLHKSNGTNGGYYWGMDVKNWLLAHERRHAHASHAA